MPPSRKISSLQERLSPRTRGREQATPAPGPARLWEETGAGLSPISCTGGTMYDQPHIPVQGGGICAVTSDDTLSARPREKHSFSPIERGRGEKSHQRGVHLQQQQHGIICNN